MHAVTLNDDVNISSSPQLSVLNNGREDLVVVSTYHHKGVHPPSPLKISSISTPPSPFLLPLSYVAAFHHCRRLVCGPSKLRHRLRTFYVQHFNYRQQICGMEDHWGEWGGGSVMNDNCFL